MFWRSLKGAVLGAVVTTAIAVALMGLLFGIHLLEVAQTPIDRSDSLNHLLKTLPLVAIAGAMIGALSGLAAKLPRHGMRMLPSITIVTACAVLARIPTATHPRYKDLTGPSGESSYLPVIIAAVVGSLIVLVYGMVLTKRSISPESPDKEKSAPRQNKS